MQFCGGPVATNGWLLGDPGAGEAMVVDAPWGMADAAMADAQRRGVRITVLVNTHGHWDHIGDNAVLRARTGAPLLAHRLDAELLAHPHADGFTLPQEIYPITPDRWIGEGDVVAVGTMTFAVLATPGHSPGGICLHEPRERVLLSGDTLFDGAYGRTDLAGSNERAMWESLLRLAALPADTRVYPGHGDPTTIGDQTWLTNLARSASGATPET